MTQVLEQQRFSEEEQVMAAFRLWLDAINRHDTEAVCALYDSDAILLPTLNPDPLGRPEQIADYFTSLLAREELHCTLDDHLLQLDDDIATLAGHYHFSFLEGGSTVKIFARFSFTYRLRNGEWRIISHHSARMAL